MVFILKSIITAKQNFAWFNGIAKTNIFEKKKYSHELIQKSVIFHLIQTYSKD
jgi:hypothetical protein